LVTGVLAGLAPALHVSRPDLNEVLKEGGRGGTTSLARRRLRALLVVSEVSLALVLLVGAGMMVKGFRNLANKELGFDRQHLLTFRITLSEKKYDRQDRIRGFYDQAIQKLRGLPGVASAGAVTSLPGSWSWTQTEYNAEGQPAPAPGELRTTVEQFVTPDFFQALRVSLIKGRSLSPQDGSDAPSAIVISEGLAQRIWPDWDPIGKRMKFGPEIGSKKARSRRVGYHSRPLQCAFRHHSHRSPYLRFVHGVACRVGRARSLHPGAMGRARRSRRGVTSRMNPLRFGRVRSSTVA